MNSGPVISSSVGGLITWTWPHRWPLLFPRSRNQRPPQKSPPLPVAAYRGSYANAYYGEIEIIEKEGVLQLQVGPRDLTYPLAHWDRDVFTYQPTGESAGGPSGVTFVIGPDRRASQVVIENLNRHGEGVFTR